MCVWYLFKWKKRVNIIRYHVIMLSLRKNKKIKINKLAVV